MTQKGEAGGMVAKVARAIQLALGDERLMTNEQVARAAIEAIEIEAPTDVARYLRGQLDAVLRRDEPVERERDMSQMIERLAKAMYDANGFVKPWEKATAWHGHYRQAAVVALEALREPTKPMWIGLARDIVMWMDAYPGAGMTPRNLFTHLDRIGRDIPAWLRDEPEMMSLDHVPSKGTRAAVIWRAMIEDALEGGE